MQMFSEKNGRPKDGLFKQIQLKSGNVLCKPEYLHDLKIVSK